MLEAEPTSVAPGQIVWPPAHDTAWGAGCELMAVMSLLLGNVRLINSRQSLCHCTKIRSWNSQSLWSHSTTSNWHNVEVLQCMTSMKMRYFYRAKEGIRGNKYQKQNSKWHLPVLKEKQSWDNGIVSYSTILWWLISPKSYWSSQ